MYLNSNFSPESNYQEFTEPETGELDQMYPICELCNEHSAMIEVTFQNRKELTCMGCYGSPDYQLIIKRDNPKIKTI